MFYQTCPIIQKECIPTNQIVLLFMNLQASVILATQPNTTQRLEDWIKQHVHREQPLQSCRSRNIVKTSDSAIGKHLLDNPDCAKLYKDNMFQIIGRDLSPFHLAALDSLYIQTKKPPMCRQKEFISSLGLH